MKIRNLIIVVLFALTFVTCKNSGQNTTELSSTENSEMTGEPGEGFMKDRPTGEQDHDWTFLTNQLFHYDAGFRIGQKEGEKAFEGHWIDLDSDGTFETGIYGKTSYAGQWTYDHDKQHLTLYPDPEDVKNSQWQVMSNDDMVVLVGTATYGDNTTQARLVRYTEKPKK